MPEEKPGNIINISKYIVYAILIISSVYVVYDIFLGRWKAKASTNQKLVITGHKQLSKEEIIELLGIQSGRYIDDYNFKELAEKLKKHPRIKDATLTRRSKDQVLLSIIERKAKYIAHTKDNIYEIDDSFSPISIGDIRETSAIIVSGDFSMDPENKMGTKFRDFANSLNELLVPFPSLKERISEVFLGSDGEIVIYIHSPKKIKVLMGDVLNSKQFRKLYSALAYFENQKSSVQLLDLRGDDAIYY